jgi:nicotinic acid mononucleotide adenylyltransferase
MEQSLAIDSESLDVSSTDVRQLIEQKKSEVAKIIASEDILEYIQKNKLYT